MKTLHLLRHAKSAWDEPGLSDRERGLNKRGKSDAPRMGEALSQEIEPMVIHASPATRAQLTLKGLCRGWPELADLPHVTVEALYTFDAGEVLDWLSDSDDDDEALFLIGHNPAFTDLINWLAPDTELDNLPTAAYARLSLDVTSWNELSENCGDLAELLRPKALR